MPGRLRSIPLATFVHVPKTGGTSINNALRRIDPFGEPSIDRVLIKSKRDIYSWDLRMDPDRLHWISGHVRFDVLARCLAWYPKPVEYFAAVREPTAQIASHVNFILTQARNNDFASRTTRETLRNLRIAATNFGNPHDVMRMLLEHRDFLLNNQARTVLGTDFDMLSESEIIQRLKRYQFIARQENLSELIVAMGYHRDCIADGIEHANTSAYEIDKAMFYEEPLKSFLAQFNAFDEKLYRIVSETQPLSMEPEVLRPDYTTGGAFDLDDFDEEAYLWSCPDVDLVVKRNQIQSGWDHFSRFGQFEGRSKIVAVTRTSASDPEVGTGSDAPINEESPVTTQSEDSAIERMMSEEQQQWWDDKPAATRAAG